MWWAVDLLANEYGGGPRAILDGVYLDELIYLTQQITRRKVDEWKMQAALASFPWMEKEDRKQFFNRLDTMRTAKKKSKFDEAGFNALKIALSQNPKFIVK